MTSTIEFLASFLGAASILLMIYMIFTHGNQRKTRPVKRAQPDMYRWGDRTSDHYNK